MARGFATLGQTAKTYCVGAASERDGLIGHSYEIPGDIFLNREMGKPIARERDLRRSRRCGDIHLHGSVLQAHVIKAADDFTPVVILPYARDDLGLRAQSMCVIGEVRWRSA